MTRAALLLPIALFVTACETQTQSQEAHVHGLARLSIAVEEPGRATLILEAPGVTLFGFEHAARTAEEVEAEAAALALLRDRIADLVVLPADRGCRFEVVELGVSREDGDDHGAGDTHDDEGDHTDANADAHDDEGARDDEGAHDDDAHDDDAQAAGLSGEHSEVHAEYQLRCDQALDGARARVLLGDFFPGLETLHVTLLTASGQRSSELRGGRGELGF